MAGTRSVVVNGRLAELEQAAAEMDETLVSQMQELFALRQQQQHLDARLSSASQVGVQALRLPGLDRFSGDREETAAFIRALDTRLSATGQQQSAAGLQFAVAHLTGYASRWWLSYSVSHTNVQTWPDFKEALKKEFVVVDDHEQSVLEARMLDLKQTGSFDEYVSEFLDLEIRLTDQTDGFKQRCFLRNSNAYLRDRFAVQKFDSVSELVSESLRLKGKVERSKFEADAVAVPVSTLR